MWGQTSVGHAMTIGKRDATRLVLRPPRRLRIGAVLCILLLQPAVAVAWGVPGCDLVYDSPAKVSAGISLTTSSAQVFGTRAASARLGVGLAGASVSAGVSWFFASTLASFHLRGEALQTFDSSPWHSGTWVGPELRIDAAFIVIGVGVLQGVGHDHSTRTQLSAGLSHWFFP